MLNKYIKSIVYGGIDGIITTFAIVAGATGAQLETKYVIALGIGNVLADGFSMAMGDYLSTRAEEKEKELAVKNGIMTFISFLAFGIIPLFSYFIQTDNPYLMTGVFTGLALLALGIVKAKITNTSIWISAITMLSIGGITALVAYYIGEFFSTVL